MVDVQRSEVRGQSVLKYSSTVRTVTGASGVLPHFEMSGLAASCKLQPTDEIPLTGFRYIKHCLTNRLKSLSFQGQDGKDGV